MTKTINKASKTLGGIQYHLQIKPGDIAPFVLLPGDPDRVLRIAKYLDDVKEIAYNREFRTITGKYNGILITATSTGIGCPSAAIAVEELANVGASHFIRVGSTAAIQEGIQIGDMIISTGAMRNEGTTSFYVSDGYPAVPDHFLTHALIKQGLRYKKDRDFNVFYGIGASDDSFYAETPEFIDKLSQQKILNVEMEASAIFTIAHQRQLKAAMICAVSGNLVEANVVYEEENKKLVEGWENAIQISLAAISDYKNKGYEKLGQ